MGCQVDLLHVFDSFLPQFFKEETSLLTPRAYALEVGPLCRRLVAPHQLASSASVKLLCLMDQGEGKVPVSSLRGELLS